MIYEGTLGFSECVSTLICLTLTHLVLTLPHFSADDFGTASFAQAIYVTIIAGLFLTLLFKLSSKFKDADIIDISENEVAKPFKYITGFIFIAYFFSSLVLTLSELSQNIKNILFPDTPVYVISFFFIFAIVIGSLIGLKGIMRTSALIMPLIIIGFVSMFASLFSEVSLTNFTPTFGEGIKEFFINGSVRFGRFDAMILLLLFKPCIKNFKKTSIYSYVAISTLILASFFLIFGIISYPSVTENFFPLFEISRLISYGRFVERVESVFSLIWLIVTLIYMSLLLSVICQILKKLFNIKYTNRIIPSIAISVLTISLMFSSHIEILIFRRILSINISPVAMFFYPLLILIIASVKKRIKD